MQTCLRNGKAMEKTKEKKRKKKHFNLWSISAFLGYCRRRIQGYFRVCTVPRFNLSSQYVLLIQATVFQRRAKRQSDSEIKIKFCNLVTVKYKTNSIPPCRDALAGNWFTAFITTYWSEQTKTLDSLIPYQEKKGGGRRMRVLGYSWKQTFAQSAALKRNKSFSMKYNKTKKIRMTTGVAQNVLWWQRKYVRHAAAAWVSRWLTSPVNLFHV